MPFDVILAGALGLSVLLFALAGGGGFWRGIVVALGAQGRAGHGAAAAHRASDRPALGGERALGGGLGRDPVERVRSSLRGLWDGALCPFVLAIAGVLLRGAFLAFRIEAQEEAPRAYVFFGEIFGSMSIITPFFLGTAAGAIASGRLRLNENELPVDGYFQPWIGPFPIIVGLLGVATCAYLSAIYLTIDAADEDPRLQEDFRVRG